MQRYRRILIPIMAAVVALVGTAALLITELDLRDDARGKGISMITTAVAQRAGATVSESTAALPITAER